MVCREKNVFIGGHNNIQGFNPFGQPDSDTKQMAGSLLTFSIQSLISIYQSLNTIQYSICRLQNCLHKHLEDILYPLAVE